jgi:uncharacterized protein YutE (UPF0331/DUF86 family)
MNGEIASKLKDLEKYAQLLEQYKKRGMAELQKDLTLRGAVERYMQLAIEIVIEIGEMIIAREGFQKPETYKEVIEILGREGVLEQKFARKFAPAAGFRNILVHMYGGIHVDELYDHLQKDVGDFDTFAKQIAGYLKKKSA